MTTTPDTPTYSYSSDGPPYGSWDGQVPPPPPAPPAPPAAGRPRRTAALLVAGALACAGVGGGTAHLLDGAPAPVLATAAASSGLPGTSTVSAPAPATSGTAAAAAKVIVPSVVTIAVTGTKTTAGGFGQAYTSAVSDTGSGIVLRSDGYVLTNNHVVAAAASGGTVSVTTSGGKTYPATIVGTDPTSDLAVVRVSGASLTPATFADSAALSVGQNVLAVGAPLGLSGTVTEGIVSTLHRPVSTGEPGATSQSVLDAIQTDAAINPGNSGGALVDLAGRVVGVNSAIASTGSSGAGAQSGNIGVGFAIPSNDAKRVAEQLIAAGHATHPQMGVSVADAPAGAQGTPGLGSSVQAVAPGGPAAAAGLQPGDVVTAVGGRTVSDANSLIVAVRAHNPGERVQVTYLRGGQSRTTTVVLATASPTN